MKVICDIETDRIDRDGNVSVIHCVVCKDVLTEQVFIFGPRDKEEFKKFSQLVTHWIGHNFIEFDMYWLNKLWDCNITVKQVTDTLVLSRLFNKWWLGKDRKMKSHHDRHNLDAWGERLSYPKLPFKEFDHYSQEMLEYCINDVELTHLVWKELKKLRTTLFKHKWSNFSIDLEHQTQYILSKQRRGGFSFDLPAAFRLLEELKGKSNEIEQEILRDFKPKAKLVKEYYPRLNMDGSHNKSSLGPLRDDYGLFYHGDPYSYITFEPFNLASPVQIIDRLDGYWKPVEFTPKGSPKVSEANLETVTDEAPESIKNLALYRLIQSRISMIEQWIDACDSRGRLRGSVLNIGAWTQRKAHIAPNTANIPGNRGLWGHECRELWTCDEGEVVVGTDASGIQLRVLAHYINHPKYTEMLLDGDIHQFNMDNLQPYCKERDDAKRFIYSWLLGAGAAKTAWILGCTLEQAIEARDKFVQLTPGLPDLLYKKKLVAQRGYFVGFDGRIVSAPSDHHTLTGFLQAGESIIMKLANAMWDKRATEAAIRFRQQADVHDEWQTACEKDRAKELGGIQVQAIRDAGKYLKLNCPLDGEFKIGKTWANTH